MKFIDHRGLWYACMSWSSILPVLEPGGLSKLSLHCTSYWVGSFPRATGNQQVTQRVTKNRASPSQVCVPSVCYIGTLLLPRATVDWLVPAQETDDEALRFRVFIFAETVSPLHFRKALCGKMMTMTIDGNVLPSRQSRPSDPTTGRRARRHHSSCALYQ